jgi:hypothetical protein
MYYRQNEHIVETDNIDAIQRAYLTEEEDGVKLLHVTFVLKPDANITTPESFHLTNGVEHRLLHIPPEEPAPPSEEPFPPPEEPAPPSEEQVQEDEKPVED